MARISKFPLSNTTKGFSRPGGKTKSKGAEETREKLLDTILQLAWEDIDTYIFLEEICTEKTSTIEQVVYDKLRSLNLIDARGYPLLHVRSIMRSISEINQKQYYVM